MIVSVKKKNIFVEIWITDWVTAICVFSNVDKLPTWVEFASKVDQFIQ